MLLSSNIQLIFIHARDSRSQTIKLRRINFPKRMLNPFLLFVFKIIKLFAVNHRIIKRSCIKRVPSIQPHAINSHKMWRIPVILTRVKQLINLSGFLRIFNNDFLQFISQNCVELFSNSQSAGIFIFLDLNFALICLFYLWLSTRINTFYIL